MSTYDDGEGDTPGDPTLDELNFEKLQELQYFFDDIDRIVNPTVQADAAKLLVKQMNMELHKCIECGAEYIADEAQPCNHRTEE
jgi:hypothetical protein